MSQGTNNVYKLSKREERRNMMFRFICTKGLCLFFGDPLWLAYFIFMPFYVILHHKSNPQVFLFYIPAACILFNGLCSDSTLKVHYFAFRRVTSRTGLFSRIYVYVGLEWTRTTRVRFASWDFEKRTLKREVESWSIFPCVKRQAIILPEQVSEWWLSKSSGKCKLIMFRL